MAYGDTLAELEDGGWVNDFGDDLEINWPNGGPDADTIVVTKDNLGKLVEMLQVTLNNLEAEGEA